MHPSNLSSCLVIAGPTASGKSSLAIEIARRLNGEILACDAMQIYAGMAKLSAQVVEEDRQGIPHHLMGCLDPSEKMDAARYRKLALEKLKKIQSAGRLPIVVGGTGLYLRALLFGLDSELPAPDPALREQWLGLSQEQMVGRLLELDPDAGAVVDLQNPRRVLRALEVVSISGKPMQSFRSEQGPPPAGVSGFLIVRTRENLLHRIAVRSRAMWESGVLDEIQALPIPAGPTAESAIGLREGRGQDGQTVSREDWIESVTVATRQYAKRQMTWFRREKWLKPIEVMPEETDAEVADRVLQLFRREGEAPSEPDSDV